MFCACSGGEDCNNPFKKHVVEDESDSELGKQLRLFLIYKSCIKAYEMCFKSAFCANSVVLRELYFQHLSLFSFYNKSFNINV